MNIKKIILIPIFSIILVILGILFVMLFIGKKESNNIVDDNDSIEISLYDRTVQEIDVIKEKIDDSLGYYSSPYTLMENNKYYDELVSLGIKAIKPLYDMISSSPDSGLIEYIYAMAIEDIMAQKFGNEIGWATAKEFENIFLSFIIEIPINYKNIKDDSNLSVEDKINKINELGLAVVPFIIDDINKNSNSDIDYKETLISVLYERNQINLSSDNFNIDNWIKNNKEYYYSIKLIVS